MPVFYGLAAALVLLAIFFAVTPLLRGREVIDKDELAQRQQANIDLFKERLSELESDWRRGDYSEAEFELLKVELQQRLLDDTASVAAQSKSAFAGLGRWPVAIVLALVIPVLAFWAYSHLGAVDDLKIQQVLARVQQQAAEGEDYQPALRELFAQVEQRLQHQPENIQYLMIAARAGMELSDYPAAAEAYRRLSLLMPEDPMVVGQNAQALYLASNRQLTPQVQKLIDRALALNPNQTTVLGLLGIHHFEHGQFGEAVDAWQRLLSALDPGSANARMIRQGIAQAREKAGQAGQVIAPASTAEQVAGDGAAVEVAVALADGMKAPAGSSVFVYARAVNGPRMPLAVARLAVEQLPTTVRLDDSMAMAPNFKLSSFAEVELVARISSSGIANAASGDIEGVVGPVSVKDAAGPVTLLINEILP